MTMFITNFPADAYVTYFIVDFVMMFVVMVTNLILYINHENDELRLMMKTRLLPEQRRALALTNPALFLIIQRCLRHFSLRSSKMCFHRQDPIQKDTILLNYCIDDIEAKCRKLRERRAQVFIPMWLKC